MIRDQNALNCVPVTGMKNAAIEKMFISPVLVPKSYLPKHCLNLLNTLKPLSFLNYLLNVPHTYLAFL